MSLLHLFAAGQCGNSSTVFDTSCLPNAQGTNTELQTILRIVFGIVGALAFLMLVISGFRYIIAGGNPEDMSRAKDSIIYALVGVIVALLAEAIVAFVLGNL